MSAPFALKPYQTATLKALENYLAASVALKDPDTAFYQATKRPYYATDPLPGVPHICLRVPTGGGKTILAAHTVQVASDAWLRTDTPCVIWLTPSQTIRDQTLATLQNRAHPNRQALAARFGENVRVMGIADALYTKRADYDGGAVIVVATIQTFRVDDKEQRKVFDVNGELGDHFLGLDPALRDMLEVGEDGTPKPSLGNVFAMRRPLIIVDEAHGARTDLSFATLARLKPSLIVEFTATPIKADEHKPEKGVYASNVLHMVSASELKAAEMIKLPLMLSGRSDPNETINDAICQLDELDAIAGLERAKTGEFVRPIMLIQAEPQYKDRPSLHAEEVRTKLIADFSVPASDIAMATGKVDELEGVNLFDPKCQIRFVITQSKLREGWDCSFAYVLCSVAEQNAPRAVEQLLGRVLRLPNARRKVHKELNQAYAFATTTSFQTTAGNLKEGLVQNGFERIEADDLIRTSVTPFDQYSPNALDLVVEEALPSGLDLDAFKAKIESVSMGRVTVDLDAGVMRTQGMLSNYQRQNMLLAVPEVAARAVDALVHKSRGARLAPVAQVETDIVFAVPRLCVRKGNQLSLFDRTEFLDNPWRLDQCDAGGIVDHFKPPNPSQNKASIDVDSVGNAQLEFVDDLTRQMSLIMAIRGFSRPGLIGWLDKRLPSRKEIRPASSAVFIDKALSAIEWKYQLDIDQIARAKAQVLEALCRGIDDLRDKREAKAFQLGLFGDEPLPFETSADMALVFEEARYAYNQPYSGNTAIKKHLFRVVGDLESKGEEYDCAIYLDIHPRVTKWVRNTVKPDSFWLQTASDKFYPDFIALLDDGRYLVIEYKGAHLVSTDDTKDKDLIGNIWAEKSGGKGLFLTVSDRQFGLIDKAIA
jgi:type III restriction enzyme